MSAWQYHKASKTAEHAIYTVIIILHRQHTAVADGSHAMPVTAAAHLD